MRSRSRIARRLSRKVLAGYYLPNPANWNRLVDVLSMHLCPPEEWQAYEKKMNEQAKLRASGGATIYIFPVWRKYRQQARKIASLQNFAPVLRHLPLPVSCFLGKVFF
jgi:hypothetical protein